MAQNGRPGLKKNMVMNHNDHENKNQKFGYNYENKSVTYFGGPQNSPKGSRRESAHTLNCLRFIFYLL